MAFSESERHQPPGLFDNEEIMSTYQALRKEVNDSEQITNIIKRIENAGPIMVVDPEKAYYNLNDTLERVRIASRNGMEVMELGGSTNANNEAETVIPLIREAVREVNGNTLLVSFPGTSDQVIKGIDATFSLWLPQLNSVFKKSPQIAQYLNREYLEIINRSNQLNIPIIPVTYILFNAGKKTSVEKATEIHALEVKERVNTELIMNTIEPWLNKDELVMLEMGSDPDKPVNLGPVATEVYKKTQVRPIITGGVSTPEHIKEITKHTPSPVVFGSVAENTPPYLFENLYKKLRNAHPSCQ